MRIEQVLSKDEILELYLNRIYFGDGTYGVGAAHALFRQGVAHRTLSEAALLAGLPKAPSRYSPRRSVKLASARVDEVLENMVQAGYLSPEQARSASQQPLKLRPSATTPAIPIRSIGWPSCCRSWSASRTAI